MEKSGEIRSWTIRSVHMAARDGPARLTQVYALLLRGADQAREISTDRMHE